MATVMRLSLQELQPSVWAIKRSLMRYAQRGMLEFYLDLHAHANKKGVFIFGNTLEGDQVRSSPRKSLYVLLLLRAHVSWSKCSGHRHRVSPQAQPS